MTKRKKWSGAMKFEIALQVLKGEETLNGICKRYNVAPSQVHVWKKELLEKGGQLFEKAEKSEQKASASSASAEQKQRELYEKIGQLTIERDFLKKAWSKLHGRDDESC